MQLPTRYLIGLVAFACGCGDDAHPGTGGPDTSDLETPILERPSSDELACSEGVAPTQPSVKDWRPAAVVAVGNEVWALQAGEGEMFFGKIDADGTLGTRHDLGPMTVAYGEGAAHADGSSVTLVWAEFHDDTAALRHAVVDVAKGVTTPKHDLVTANLLRDISLAANGTTLAAAWSEEPDEEGAAKVRFARLGADGIDGEIVDVVADDGAYGGLAPAMVAYKAGFALSWSEGAPGGDDTPSERWFVRLDAHGQKTSEPLRVSPALTEGFAYGTTFYSGASSMLVVGDDVWLAYFGGFSKPDFENPEGTGILRIAIVDANGHVIDVPLNPAVTNKLQTEGNLFAFGDAVGVAWTGGTTIFECAGCFVDYDLQVALIDPTTLELVADPFTHTHNAHGYRNLRVAVAGNDIYTLAMQDFHAISFPAIARATCVPK